MGVLRDMLVVVFLSVILRPTFTDSASCSNQKCMLMERCSKSWDCAAGLYCFACRDPGPAFSRSRCVRSTVVDPFKVVNTSMPFNKYAFLTTHNSFAFKQDPPGKNVPRVTFINQEDSITEQLKNGVRALMLDTYDYKGDIWLCHSFKGKCHAYTAFGTRLPTGGPGFESQHPSFLPPVMRRFLLHPHFNLSGPSCEGHVRRRAIDIFREIEAFMTTNPSAIVTIILEDYVEAPKGLTRVFEMSGLMKYWFPVSKMPQNGQDWPLVKDMIAKNQRLIVFTSMKSKQQSEGIAYQWDYMVENQYGNEGTKPGNCPKRKESAPMNDRTKSLVLVNHFRTIPVKLTACEHNSQELIDMLRTCHVAAGYRWANFVAVDYYKRSSGGGVFQAVDTLNGELMCGCNDIHACRVGSSPRTCQRNV